MRIGLGLNLASSGYGQHADQLRVSSAILQTDGLTVLVVLNEVSTLVSGSLVTAFSVYVDTIEGTVGTAVLVVDTITITMQDIIRGDEVVTLSYDDTIATITGDTTGTDLQTFVSMSVLNNSEVSGTGEMKDGSPGEMRDGTPGDMRDGV